MFPVHGLLPKEATQAASFVKKYGEWDGRGTVMAILDTGVDPGAPGLQTTTDGQPKVVDCIDCTGSGDVAMTSAIKVSDKKTVVGLSGRILSLNTAWHIVDDEVRLGIKRASDLFPANLVARLAQERRDSFEVEQQRLMAEAQAQLAAAYPTKTAMTEHELEARVDLEARIAALKEAMTSYEHLGPVYDCIVFFDGRDWRAAIDTAETGDLTNAVAMTDYYKERQLGRFGNQDYLNYSFNIYDDGATLSIVTVAGSHGTHVAAIAAAHHPQDPAINGVAPGAQLISLKIGDTRLGSMETGTGLTRAIHAMVRWKCDLANMSYGEDAAIHNAGFWIDLLRHELINKYNCVFVSSAGNAGPALSTVGAPGGTTTGVIGVGAYCTAEMAEAEYALLDHVPETPYTWSSRGPTLDGDRGVSIYAPGAAITSVPQYLLKNSQLMNGTSMSSPNACGCIALLLSALKHPSIAIPYTPYRIKKALENSAKDIKDPLGIGFLQVEHAWEYLRKWSQDKDLDIRFDVSVNGRARGVYLRELEETNKYYQAHVSIQATFRKEPTRGTAAPTEGDTSQNDNKLAYEQRLTLVATAPWVQTPDFLLMNSGGREFQIGVDPTKLAPGLHVAEVQAIDALKPEKGPVFRLPVTVLKPMPLTNEQKCQVVFKSTFTPGHVERRFVQVPPGATYADLRIKTSPSSSPSTARLVVHLLQAVPLSRHTRTEQHWYLNIKSADPVPEKCFKVHGGIVMEVCTAQFWSSLGTYEVEFELEFHGISVAAGDSKLVFEGGKGVERLELQAPLKQEECTLGFSFDTLRKHLRPSESVIRPLKTRDILPTGKILMELILSYSVKITEAAGASVTFRKPLLDDILYESSFDSVLVMVHDAHKRMLHFQDVYPKQIKLPKGDYTVRVQIRHEAQEVLEQVKSMVLLAEYKLTKSESVDVFKSIPEMFQPGKKAMLFKKTRLSPGRQYVVYANLQKLASEPPNGAEPGDELVGEVTFGAKVDGQGPNAIYVVPPAPAKDSAASDATKGKDEKAGSKEGMEDAMRDLKLAWVKQLKEKEDKAALMKQLVDAYPDHLSVLVQKLELEATVDTETEKERALKSEAICAAAKAVLAVAKEGDVLKFLGAKPPAVQTEEYKKQKKDMDERKKAIALAYFRQVEAFLCCAVSASDTATQESAKKQLEKTWPAFWPFIDLSGDVKHVFVAVARERMYGRPGSALKILNKYLSEQGAVVGGTTTGCTCFLGVFDQPSTSLGGVRAGEAAVKTDGQKMLAIKLELYEAMKWQCWVRYEKQWNVVRFPKEFAPF